MGELAAVEEKGQEGQQQQQPGDARWRLPGGRSVRLLQAGACSSCSQKIHK
jgi:hypothetical protein